MIQSPDPFALHSNLNTYRTAHEVSPCLRQKVAAGSRKHSHQLLQWLELHTTTHTRKITYNGLVVNVLSRILNRFYTPPPKKKHVYAGFLIE